MHSLPRAPRLANARVRARTLPLGLLATHCRLPAPHGHCLPGNVAETVDVFFSSAFFVQRFEVYEVLGPFFITQVNAHP
jgi:hypothetical protein